MSFEIRVPPSVRAEPLTGRVYVILAHDTTREPRLQVGRVGAPLFGRDVERLAPGAAAIVNGADLGTPVADMADLPAGDYFVQPFVNVYSEFTRADGHVLWMHDDQWEGQNWLRSPGNIYGAPQRVHLDPEVSRPSRSTADTVIPPDRADAGRRRVRAAVQVPEPDADEVLGPADLSRRDRPAAARLQDLDDQLSGQLHPGAFRAQSAVRFSTTAGGRGGRGAAAATAFRDAWLSDNFPRVIAVTFQHPTPYFDDSYAVNSVNVGPYGDAIMQELIPEIEKRYRTIREPWARWLTGGSTGGWEALALQIFHPDFFGGTWASCPDPVTFTDVEGVDIYKDANAFYKSIGDFQRTPTVNSREVNGEIRQTAQQRYWMELVNGTHGRSGTGPAGHLAGGVRPDRRRRLLQAAGRFTHRRHRPIGRAVLEGALRPPLLPAAQLADGGAEARRQAARLRRQHGQLLPRPRRPRDGSVDEDHPESALRRLLHVRRSEAALLERSGTSADRIREMAEYGLRKKPAGTTTPWWKYLISLPRPRLAMARCASPWQARG